MAVASVLGMIESKPEGWMCCQDGVMPITSSTRRAVRGTPAIRYRIRRSSARRWPSMSAPAPAASKKDSVEMSTTSSAGSARHVDGRPADLDQVAAASGGSSAKG